MNDNEDAEGIVVVCTVKYFLKDKSFTPVEKNFPIYNYVCNLQLHPIVFY